MTSLRGFATPLRARRNLLLALLAAVVLAMFAVVPSIAAGHAQTRSTCRSARVMTWNLYLGADLRPAYVPTTLPGLEQAATQVAFQVAATDFPRRAQAIAADIQAGRPDLIGLQEAAIWKTQFPSNPAKPAQHVRYDFLAILQHALARRGLHYALVASVNNASFQVPTSLGFDISVTDRDVILARVGSSRGALTVTDSTAGEFAAGLPIPNPFLPVTITRGWVAVDASLQGCPFRFVSTHLDGDSATVQMLQALQLVSPGGPAGATGPLVLVGDFNAKPGIPTYNGLIAAGFQDAWSQVRADPGYTCCHDVAALLRNPFDQLTGRSDLVLVRGGPYAVSARLYGTSIRAWRRLGMWPSDHAGLLVSLRLK